MERRRIVSWCLVAAALGVVWAVALADTVKTRDGKTYTGAVDLLGDKVRVTQADGVSVILDKSQVAEIIRTRTPLQEYARREAQIRPDDANGRFNLALWCDRNGLKTEAIREAAKALAIRPDHPGARELMLHLLREPGLKPGQPAADRTDTSPAAPAAVTGKNLLLEERPATQRYFRMRVQPILNSRCASAQCHGGFNAGKLHLKRMRIGTPATRDVYLPNFDAIYPYITDFYRPEKSLLLRHPLAVKAGGIPSKCKKVFQTTSDPQFRTIGRLIRMLLLPAPPPEKKGAEGNTGG